MAITTQTHEFTIFAPTKITPALVDEILSGAFEGGSNYWCGKVRKVGTGEPAELAADLVAAERDEWWTTYTEFLYNEENSAIVYVIDENVPDWDIVDGVLIRYAKTMEEETHSFNLASIRQAFTKIATKWTWHYNNLMKGNADGETYDVFFQVAVFGDIIYG